MNKNNNWDKYFGLAKIYYEYYGNLDIPHKFSTINGYTYEKSDESLNLGNWLDTQRANYKAGKLSDDKIKQLESIGARWSIHINWEEGYKLASIYYNHHGNLDISHRFSTKNGYEFDNTEGSINLGRWIATQRNFYKAGTLSEERIKKLEAIGMAWNSLEKSWNDTYNLAQKYYNHHGNLKAPISFSTKNGYEFDDNEGSINLGKWLHTQRTNYNAGKLTKERIEKLENIGIIWKVNLPSWDDIYALAKIYYEYYGNLEVPIKFNTKNGYIHDNTGNGNNLGIWIQNQRQFYKKGKLSEDRIKKLENIGMIWTFSDKWYDYYELAKTYFEYHGNLKIPVKFNTKNGYLKSYEEGAIKLGSWISGQRVLYQKEILSKERIKLLEEIDMIWDAKRTKSKDKKYLCRSYGIDYEKYLDLERIPYKVLLAKINYLVSNNIPLVNTNNELNPIFFMSDINMQVVYGINLEELVKEYSKKDRRSSK